MSEGKRVTAPTLPDTVNTVSGKVMMLAVRESAAGVRPARSSIRPHALTAGLLVRTRRRSARVDLLSTDDSEDENEP
ncbi:hypothetical protein EVAR_54836_1 [Eumeta japonica]|uniref:Uncharacterized protein n=1 Tax=Eumeta variegata TaxID=151549 RepID=A0A4C1ZEK7_EUMVA|nr:hypothetical protein EVAR_54836_1 [Eumeta japonica]